MVLEDIFSWWGSAVVVGREGEGYTTINTKCKEVSKVYTYILYINA